MEVYFEPKFYFECCFYFLKDNKSKFKKNNVTLRREHLSLEFHILFEWLIMQYPSNHFSTQF
jgi:hypothetical protein